MAYLSDYININGNAAILSGNITSSNINTGNVLTISGIPLTITAGNVLSVDGEPLVVANSNSAISTTGNVNAGYFVGNGSLLTGIVSSYGNANVTAYLPTYTGIVANLTIQTALTNYQDENGTPISFGNGNTIINNLPSGANTEIQFNSGTGNFAASSNFTYNVATGNVDLGGNLNLGSASIWKYDAASLTVTANSQNNINGVTFREGGVSAIYAGTDVIIETNDNDLGNVNDWTFSSTGNLVFPDNTTLTGDTVTSPVNASYSINTSQYIQESADAIAGSGADLFIADTSSIDDITVVQVGWQINSGTVESPIWLDVTDVDGSVPNQYSITVPGFTFVDSNNYTFRNPVPSTNTWEFTQGGALSIPGGGTIQNTNNDLFVTVSGTDIIGLRSDGGDVILDAQGNLNIPANLVSTTSVSRLSLNETGIGDAYLTSTDDNSTAVLMNTTGIQEYAGITVDIVAGTMLPGLETDYTDAQIILEDAFTQNSAEPGYPWGITLPTSYLTYSEIILLTPGTFPNQVAVTAQSLTTQNLYELWQGTVADTNVTITANENNWVFDNNGSTVLPTVANESAKFIGTRKVVGGLDATSPYSVILTAGGTPTVAYTSLAGTSSVRVTFAVNSNGSGYQWEQFDVIAVASQDVAGEVNFVVSNRVKGAAGISDTVVTATMNGQQMKISLTLDPSQTAGGWASFDAVEFGLMAD